MGLPGDKRGFLKPAQGLQWKQGTPAPVRVKADAPAAPRAAGARPARAHGPKGLPSNAIPQAQYTLDQLKKMAASRGISVEKLLAQMVQQYLKEGNDQ
jgi:hypothetical protein